MDSFVLGLWCTAQFALEGTGAGARAAMCLHRAFQPSRLGRVFQEEQLVSAGEEQLLLGPARVFCAPGSSVASLQGTAWILGPSWALLLTACFFCLKPLIPAVLSAW